MSKKNKKVLNIIVTFVLVVIVCITVKLLYVTLLKQYMRQEVYEKVSETSEILKVSLEELIENNATAVLSISDKKALNKAFEDKNTLNRFYQIVYIDENEKVSGYSVKGKKLVYDSEKIKEIYNARGIQKMYLSKNEDGKTVMLNTSVVKDNGEDSGMVVAYYDLDIYLSKYSRDFFSMGMVDENGNILLNTEKNSKITNILESAKGKINNTTYEMLGNVLQTRGKVTFELSIDEKDKNIIVNSLNDTNYKIIYILDETEAFAYSNRVLALTLMYTLVIFISYICIYIYIVKQKSKNAKNVEEIAYLDDITGISNINKFKLDAKKFIEENKEKDIVLVSMDADDFAVINQTFGYDFGDMVLKIIGSTLKEIIKEDGLYARVNGDCFTLITTNVLEIESIIKKIEDKIQVKIELLNVKLNIHFAVGIVKLTKDDKNKTPIMQLINNANMARLTIKGKHDRILNYYDDETKSKLEEEKTIMYDLIDAIKNKEFKVYYQPKMDIKTNNIVSVEALVRWVHPEKGFISPDVFIPIAEKTRDIVSIDRMVFEEVCKTLNNWKRNNKLMVPISINISKIELFETNFVEFLEKTMRNYDVSSEYIELEITESLALRDTDYVVQIMHNVKKLGIKVSMDDFGTGYSSLACLKVLPLDYIKIDKTFIEDIETNEGTRKVLDATITLAKSLKLKVVCEGVETEKQLELLKKAKCDEAQGYVFYRPLTLADLEKRLEIEKKKSNLIDKK